MQSLLLIIRTLIRNSQITHAITIPTIREEIEDIIDGTHHKEILQHHEIE